MCCAHGLRVVILLWLFTYICRRGCITNFLERPEVIYLDAESQTLNHKMWEMMTQI